MIGASLRSSNTGEQIPVGRPSEVFDQESAGHNWLLTSRSKILKSGGSIEFFVDFHSLYRDAFDYILRKVEEISRDQPESWMV